MQPTAQLFADSLSHKTKGSGVGMGGELYWGGGGGEGWEINTPAAEKCSAAVSGPASSSHNVGATAESSPRQHDGEQPPQNAAETLPSGPASSETHSLYA